MTTIIWMNSFGALNAVLFRSSSIVMVSFEILERPNQFRKAAIAMACSRVALDEPPNVGGVAG